MFKDTIDSVIADISSKVGKLRVLAEVHSKQSEGHTKSAADHTSLAALYAENRDRATRIAIKFEELLK